MQRPVFSQQQPGVNGVPSRRGFLRIAGIGAAALAGACAPAAAPAAPGAASGAPAGSGSAPSGPSKQAWEQEWDDLVAAAKREGKVDIAWILGPAGGYQKAVDDFMKSFPGIEPGLTIQPSGSIMVPKILAEHNAGVYSYDLVFTSSTFMEPMLAVGGVQPIKPLITRPDVIDDTKWREGFVAGWTDPQKQFGYGYSVTAPKFFWMNTDLVKGEEVKTAADLLNPKWRVRMILADPRSGYTYAAATALRLNLGDDYLRKLFGDQKPVFSRDNRQITEAMVKGQYAIATGVPVQILDEFKAQGLGKNLKVFTVPEAEHINYNHQLWMLKKPSHPNSARVFMNWLLTKEGQTAYVGSTRENSRRTDVPQGDPDTAPQPGKKYLFLSGNLAMNDELAKTQKLGQDIAGLQ